LYAKQEKSDENYSKEYEAFINLIVPCMDILVDIYQNCELKSGDQYEKVNIHNLTEYFKRRIEINPKIAKIIRKANEKNYQEGDDYNLQMFSKIYKIISENLETKIKNYNTGNNKMYENLLKLIGYNTTHIPPTTIKDKRDELYNIMVDVVNSVFTIEIFIMDLYTMFRVFKKYNTSKLAFNGAIPGDQPEKSHNVIIYAGEYHSIHYRNILRKLNFVRKEQTGGLNPITSCIATEKITMPFFQKNILLGYGMQQGSNIRIANLVKPNMTPLPSSLLWGDSPQLPNPPVSTYQLMPDIDSVHKKYIDREQIKKEKEEHEEEYHEEEPDDFDNMELVNYYKTRMDILNIAEVFENKLEILGRMEVDDKGIMICD
jgi:hypothetical protein